jgi:hypothetical protein
MEIIQKSQTESFIEYVRAYSNTASNQSISQPFDQVFGILVDRYQCSWYVKVRQLLQNFQFLRYSGATYAGPSHVHLVKQSTPHSFAVSRDVHVPVSVFLDSFMN